MRYRFNQFEVDTERYELRRDGVVQPVEPLVFDLIQFLVRHPNRVISRDELIEVVWEGRTVSDATISSAIKSARRALGDSGDSQTYIRTVRGRGFEFHNAVNTLDEAAGHTPPAASGFEPQMMPVGKTAKDPKPVLVVLPFTNLSAESDEYFADGLTEDIITNLSRFRDLSVIGGASSFQFKGRAVDLAGLRARTQAGYLIQGSVRRAAGCVRISVQLIESSTGLQLWGDHYDRDMVDIFSVQDEVTRTIAATLGVTIQDVALQHALKKSLVELGAMIVFCAPAVTLGCSARRCTPRPAICWRRRSNSIRCRRMLTR